MRKADYQTLAAIIHREVQKANADEKTAFDERAERAVSARQELLEDIARELSRSLSVDKPSFLKACGIETQGAS